MVEVAIPTLYSCRLGQRRLPPPPLPPPRELAVRKRNGRTIPSMILLTFVSRGITAVQGFHPSVSVASSSIRTAVRRTTKPTWSFQLFATDADDCDTIQTASSSSSDKESSQIQSPWATRPPPISDKRQKRVNKSRFRQHVNPLARRFQMPTELPDNWPRDGSFEDPTLPLHIDIGCGKGGFLLSLAAHRSNNDEKQQRPVDTNYLGLEIRPSVAQYAQSRIERHPEVEGHVSFLGCNVNVDLRRMLQLYTAAGQVGGDADAGNGGGEVKTVSIQYPDPHFKKQHQKRRVLTRDVVKVLAEFMGEGSQVFLQSDIKGVLDGMRLAMRGDDEGGDDDAEQAGDYWVDSGELEEYLEVNPMGVPTEREVSVLDKGLPVYRVVFVRSGVKHRG